MAELQDGRHDFIADRVEHQNFRALGQKVLGQRKLFFRRPVLTDHHIHLGPVNLAHGLEAIAHGRVIGRTQGQLDKTDFFVLNRVVFEFERVLIGGGRRQGEKSNQRER